MALFKKTFMIVIVLIFIVAILLFSACKSSKTGADKAAATSAKSSESMQEKNSPKDTAAEETVIKEAEQTQKSDSAVLKEEISLPEGWALADAISGEEVGEITGKAMTYFPEANSAAQDGKPSGSYLMEGVENSKIGFYVFINSGIDEFENPKNFFIEGPDKEISGIGDKAYLCDFENGSAAIVIIKGETVIRVLWNPATYSDFEKEDFGKKLAGKLMENMYQ